MSRVALPPLDLEASAAFPSRSLTFSAAALFATGVLCYAVGVSGLVALILATLDVVPFTGGPVELSGTWPAIAFNLGLIAVFGVQHAIMARPAFKERWTRVVHPAIERSIFTALAGGLVGLIVWLWQPLTDVFWTVGDGPARWALLGLCAFGWTYLLAASFAIDHFELFGLKQVWRNLTGRPTAPPPFRARLMYRFDRHPIMTGALLGLWSAPTMTLDRMVLALGFSAYIVVGVTMEERDLRRHLGATYVSYAKRVGTIVPRIR